MDDEDLLAHILTGEGMRNYPQALRQLAAAELPELAPGSGRLASSWR
jgi:hypothetical protein